MSDTYSSNIYIIDIYNIAKDSEFNILRRIISKLRNILSDSNSLIINYLVFNVLVSSNNKLKYKLFKYIVLIIKDLIKLSAKIKNFSRRYSNTDIIIMSYSQASIINITHLICL